MAQVNCRRCSSGSRAPGPVPRRPSCSPDMARRGWVSSRPPRHRRRRGRQHGAPTPAPTPPGAPLGTSSRVVGECWTWQTGSRCHGAPGGRRFHPRVGCHMPGLPGSPRQIATSPGRPVGQRKRFHARQQLGICRVAGCRTRRTAIRAVTGSRLWRQGAVCSPRPHLGKRKGVGKGLDGVGSWGAWADHVKCLVRSRYCVTLCVSTRTTAPHSAFRPMSYALLPRSRLWPGSETGPGSPWLAASNLAPQLFTSCLLYRRRHGQGRLSIAAAGQAQCCWQPPAAIATPPTASSLGPGRIAPSNITARPQEIMKRFHQGRPTDVNSVWRARLPRRPACAPGPGSPPRRLLHLAPPFLLDDYVPRYQLLSSRDAAQKRSRAYAHLRECNLCPRKCGVNRYETTGMCLIGDKAKVNVIAPHFGEGQPLCPLWPLCPMSFPGPSWAQVVSWSAIYPQTLGAQPRSLRGARRAR